LGTAHPVKFEEAVLRAGFDMPKLPHHLKDLMEREERMDVLPADLAEIHKFIADKTFG
jgi:threonine synthase